VTLCTSGQSDEGMAVSFEELFLLFLLMIFLIAGFLSSLKKP
jgi:hypothetical protein